MSGSTIVGAVFGGVLLACALAVIFHEYLKRRSGNLMGAIFCICTAAIFLAVSFYRDGQANKTPANLVGQCVAYVQLTQYPGRNLSGDERKLNTLLYNNGGCGGHLTLVKVSSK